MPDRTDDDRGSVELDGGFASCEDSSGMASMSQGGGYGSDYASAGGADIIVKDFNELRLDIEMVEASQVAWQQYIAMAGSKDNAGEAIYTAIYESTPSLQYLFSTPKAVMALKFAAAFETFAKGLSDPAALKVAVETVAFAHMLFGVTIPLSVIFRDAVLDLFQLELGDQLSVRAYDGWRALLNYIAGAMIFIKVNYADRLRRLCESWQIANDKEANEMKLMASMSSLEDLKAQAIEAATADGVIINDEFLAETSKQAAVVMKAANDPMVQNVPTTYDEMFKFNAAVMGFGASLWMHEVLAQFDNVVMNVANSNRLQEECDVLVLRIAKITKGPINLSEYKSCMMASLRSLLPKDWTTAHEDAWSWLWDNVERMLNLNLGSPFQWEKALSKLLDWIDPDTGFQMRKDIYARFFALAPAGQDYFKQSNTYLHLIASKVLQMTLDMYKDPVSMVDDISAVGLRHVGYGITTDLFGPFVDACVEVVMGLTQDKLQVEAYRWSIGLIAKITVRTILEGSTIVMKAINADSARGLHRALSCAPRGERATWMLLIQVGTQKISPLAWAIESGALASASAMLQDLLTIRADRDRYYYASDEMFLRHPDLLKLLLNNAPHLVKEMLNGLVWRSRRTENGCRRVNYYLRHLLLDKDDKFQKTFEWVINANDPKLVTHPILVIFSDIVWLNLACRQFILHKLWFLCTLVMFVISQSIIEHWHPGEKKAWERDLTFAIRLFIYFLSCGHMIRLHVIEWTMAYRKKDWYQVFWIFMIPRYLTVGQQAFNFALMCNILVMMVSEPIFHCMSDNHGVFLTDKCAGSKAIKFYPYSVASAIAMLLYYVLLIDFAVFSNRVSAYVFVARRMVPEVKLFLFSLALSLLTFSSAFSCLEQSQKEFVGITSGTLSLWEMSMGMFSPESYTALHGEPVVLYGTFVFLVLICMFLTNVLVAQLSCAYDAVYSDMVGFARLNRINIVVENMPRVNKRRFARFVRSLALETKLEFNEGDVGLANGIQVLENANLHPTTIDYIKRFGGSTSPSIQWPEEDAMVDDDSDRFERLEQLIKKAMERICKGPGDSTKVSKMQRNESSGGSDFSGGDEE